MPSTNKRNRMMNRSRVLRTVWQHPGISRIQVAQLLGLDKSTVSSIVVELIGTGMVREIAEGSASPQGGRKPVLLELNSSFGYVIGIELQPDYYRAVLQDLNGNEAAFWEGEHLKEEGDFEEYVLTVIGEVLERADAYRDRLVGIGVAFGGLVSSISNVVYRSIPMQLDQEYDFQHRIAESVGIPVIAENDANACAWGELVAHRGQDVHDFLFVLIQMRKTEEGRHLYGGIGVGIGVVINGTLYPGSHSTAGEFRSAFWEKQGTGQFSLTDEEAGQVRDNPEILRRLFRELAKNLSLIVNVLNLDNLFIGGDMVDYRDDLSPILQEELLLHWPYKTEVDCEIRYSSFGCSAVASGAASMMLDRLFSDQIFPLGDIRNRHERGRVLHQIAERGDSLIRNG